MRVGGIKSKQVPQSLSRPDRKKKEILIPLLQYYIMNSIYAYVYVLYCNPLARICREHNDNRNIATVKKWVFFLMNIIVGSRTLQSSACWR